MMKFSLIYITAETLGQISGKGKAVRHLRNLDGYSKLKMLPQVRQSGDRKIFEYNLSTGL